MGNKFFIELASGFKNEYIIKDSIGITLGRMFILEMNREKRKVIARVKFYKDMERDFLKGVIEDTIFEMIRKNTLKGMSILVSGTSDIGAFTDLGFKVQGIMCDESVMDMEKSDYILGISAAAVLNSGMMTNLELCGRRIKLKILTPQYAEESLKYNIKNRAYLSAYEPARDVSYYTLDGQKAGLSEKYNQYLNGTSLNMGIFKDDMLIGQIQLSSIVNGILKSATLGYSVDEDEQGQGYAKEAAGLIIDYAFSEMKLHRIEASVQSDNIRSQRVVESCGFERLGLNKNYIYINGGWRDHITFYKINSRL